MNTRAADSPAFTLRQLEAMLGLSRGVVTSLVNAGFVTPARGPRNEWRFSFQDVVLLRTAHHLRTANIPSRRLLRALKQLRERLPRELPLSGLRIRAVGNDVAVREGDAQWEAVTGQLLMDFELVPGRGAVTVLARDDPGPAAAAEVPVARPTAQEWFARAEALEAHDPRAAEQAYRRALDAAPEHVYASINLGALLCDAGRSEEAASVLLAALQRRPDEPLLHFNAAIAFEDLRRDDQARAEYEACLALDPQLADAHYNLARLHERLGQPQRAVRHYNAYRRLQPPLTTTEP